MLFFNGYRCLPFVITSLNLGLVCGGISFMSFADNLEMKKNSVWLAQSLKIFPEY